MYQLSEFNNTELHFRTSVDTVGPFALTRKVHLHVNMIVNVIDPIWHGISHSVQTPD